jgi:hypothetical protein
MSDWCAYPSVEKGEKRPAGKEGVGVVLVVELEEVEAWLTSPGRPTTLSLTPGLTLDLEWNH